MIVIWILSWGWRYSQLYWQQWWHNWKNKCSSQIMVERMKIFFTYLSFLLPLQHCFWWQACMTVGWNTSPGCYICTYMDCLWWGTWKSKVYWQDNGRKEGKKFFLPSSNAFLVLLLAKEHSWHQLEMHCGCRDITSMRTSLWWFHWINKDVGAR